MEGARFPQSPNYLNQLTRVQQGTAVTTYTYDARGNQTQQVQTGTGVTTTTNYGYDLANRLISLNLSNNAVNPLSKSATYAYNAQGQRVTRVEDEVITHFYYTGSALLFTTINEYVLQTQNILDPWGTIVASKRFEGQAEAGQDPYADDYFFYRYDIRGSVTTIVDGAGAVVKHYDYDEFGVTTSTGDSFHNEVTFTGSIADASGLLYMNARYYNPSTARFLSQDSYTGLASVPWTQHLYAYCNNNPVNMVDPTGHTPESIFPDDWESIPWWKRLWLYGRIHRNVQLHIEDKNQGISIEKWVIKADDKFGSKRITMRGRVDVLERTTGSIWEVKHHNAKDPERVRALARAQLCAYAGATLVDKSLNVHYPLVVGDMRFHSSFTTEPILGKTYEVSYWSTENGIIEYTFSENTSEREGVRSKASSPVPVIVPGKEKGPRVSQSPVGLTPEGAAAGITLLGVGVGLGISFGGGSNWYNNLEYMMR